MAMEKTPSWDTGDCNNRLPGSPWWPPGDHWFWLLHHCCGMQLRTFPQVGRPGSQADQLGRQQTADGDGSMLKALQSTDFAHCWYHSRFWGSKFWPIPTWLCCPSCGNFGGANSLGTFANCWKITGNSAEIFLGGANPFGSPPSTRTHGPKAGWPLWGPKVPKDAKTSSNPRLELQVRCTSDECTL